MAFDKPVRLVWQYGGVWWQQGEGNANKVAINGAKAEITEAYEWNTGNVIVETFHGRDPLDMPAVLVWRHGPFTWSPTGMLADETAFALEVVAQMAFQTLVLAPQRGEIEPELLGRHFTRKHGSGATYGQTSQLP